MAAKSGHINIKVLGIYPLRLVREGNNCIWFIHGGRADIVSLAFIQ